MRFDWDDKKAASNLRKHNVSFEDAITAFDDPFALIAPDDKHSTESEIREWLIGEADTGVFVIVFTNRYKGRVYRIISARHANKRERRLYEQSKRVPF